MGSRGSKGFQLGSKGFEVREPRTLNRLDVHWNRWNLLEPLWNPERDVPGAYTVIASAPSPESQIPKD
jgi:hypothetical protein